MATLTVTTSTVFIGQDLTDTTEIVFDSTDVGFVVATFDASQFGGGQISETVSITGDPDFAVTFSQINVTGISGTFSAAGWSFPAIPASIFLVGSDGDDAITGNSQTISTLRGGLGADTLIAGGDTFGSSFFYVDPLEIVAGEAATGGASVFDALEVAGVGGNFDFSVATLSDIDRIRFSPGLTPTATTVTITGDQIAAGIDTIFNSSGGPAILNVLGNAVDLSALTFANWNAPTDIVTINGTGGVDSLIGSTQLDLINGLSGNDNINGFDGNDTIRGLSGNDTLRGGVGNDLLIGGAGRDVLFGDAGNDDFDFNSIAETKKGGQRDKINHFQRGQDDIDLKTIDAKTGVSGNQKFAWIGKQDFHDKKGELRYEDKGSTVIVQGDRNGDGNADFEIFVKVGSLGKGDFLL